MDHGALADRPPRRLQSSTSAPSRLPTTTPAQTDAQPWPSTQHSIAVGRRIPRGQCPSRQTVAMPEAASSYARGRPVRSPAPHSPPASSPGRRSTDLASARNNTVNEHLETHRLIAFGLTLRSLSSTALKLCRWTAPDCAFLQKEGQKRASLFPRFADRRLGLHRVLGQTGPAQSSGTGLLGL